MNDENQLRAALQEVATEREVDVTRLYAATREQLREREEQQRGRRSRTTRSVLLAAAAVVGVAALVVVTPRVSDRLLADRPDSSAGEVDTFFTCPVQQTTVFATADDDAFLPGLSPEAEPRGEAAGAPRSDVSVAGTQATLRLGNADGTLASVTTFEERDGGYERVEVTACSNGPGADPTAAPLVTDGLAPGPSTLRAEDVDADAVLVADRVTYDVRGLTTRITAFAYPCGRRVCVEAGSRGGTITRASLPRDARPVDLTSQLADPDDVVGIEPEQLLLAVHDATGSVEGVAWTDAAGERTEVDPVDGATWSGELYLALVPTDGLDELEVRFTDGGRTTYSLADLRD